MKIPSVFFTNIGPPESPEAEYVSLSSRKLSIKLIHLNVGLMIAKIDNQTLVGHARCYRSAHDADPPSALAEMIAQRRKFDFYTADQPGWRSL